MKDESLTKSQFQIVQAIASDACSASAIAKKTSISIPYVLSQLNLLEARGILKKETPSKKSKQPGKPKTHYRINKKNTQIIILRPNQASKYTIKENDLVEKYLQLLSHIPQQTQHIFSTYFWSHAQEFLHVFAIGLIKINEKEIELVAFTTKEYLTQLREQISHHKIQFKDSTTTVACWVHSVDEFCNGIATQDTYYLTLNKKIKPLVDEKEVFSTIRKGCKTQ